MAAPTVMRIHHTAPPNHQITMALHEFALDVADSTQGRVTVDVVTKRTGRPIVEPERYLEAVKSGEIEAASMPNFMWPIPEMNFSEVPYYFTSAAQVREFPHSKAAQLLDDKVAQHGVQTLAWLFVTRSTVFTSNHAPVVNPPDLAGKRIATVNAFGQTIFDPIKAQPVVVYSTLLPKAAASNEVDVIMTDVASATGLKLYEAHKFATVAPFFSAYYHLFVNPKWLAALPSRDRRAVLASARKLEENSFVFTEARAAAAPDVLREGGMTVRIQTSEEAAAWAAALKEPALKAFREQSPDADELTRRLAVLGKVASGH